jgi:DMSO/TMAO reductase YedYZ molybdopterin-dependent catalytic subunit
MPEQRRVVTAVPENSETPLEDVRSWVTPTRLFFVRNHFDVPVLDKAAWRLRVEGCVDRPLTLAWDELAELPERTVFATVECAGNGRSFLRQRADGVQWGAGAIGHAEWTGVPLRLVLQRAGVRPEAVEVLFEGADRGSEPDHATPMHFARSLPIAKAFDPDTLLVLRMNGELLDPNHGYPLRLFVPGWYGVASVKWLQRIELIDRTFDGYFQSVKYTVRRRIEDAVEPAVVGAMAVKSEIIRPAAGTTLGIGTNRVFGVAWAGEEAVARVEVSTDGGISWSDAELLGPRARYSWALWEYLWEVAQPGAYSLMARATSTSGQMQPIEHDPLNGGYQIQFSRPTTVHIAGTQHGEDLSADAQTVVYDMNAFAEENSRLQLDVTLEFSGGEGI